MLSIQNCGGVRARRAAMVLAAGAVASVGGLSSQAKAQSYTWGLTTGGTWDVATTNNWLLNGGGSLTGWANGNEAIFSGFLTSGRSVAVAAGGVTATGIVFNGFGSSFYTIGTASNTIALSNGAGEYINVGAGVFGTPTLSGTGGHTISGSPLTFANNLTINNNGTANLTNLTISGGINRVGGTGTITVAGGGNTVINTATGAIIGSGVSGIIKNGPGTLILSGSGTNTYTGGITINGGVVGIATSSDAVFGAAANGVAVNAGGVLRFNTAVAMGAARVVTLSGNSGIDLGTSVTQIIGAGQLAGNASSTLNLTVSAGTTAGILSVEGNNNSSFTGNVVVGSAGMQAIGHTFSQRVFSSSNGATLRLQNAGSLTGATAISLNNGAALTITQPTAAVTGRLSTTAAINSSSGRFQYNTSANGGTAISETFGDFNVNGYTTITGSSAAGPATGTTLNFGNLNRSDNAMVLFRGPATGTGSIGGAASTGVRMFFANLVPDTTSSGTTRSIIPWAGNATSTSSTDPQNFMTYDANGMRPLNTTTEVLALAAANTLAAAATGVNARTTGTGLTQTVKAGGQSINSLSFSGTQTLTSAAPADVLTISSGGFANFNTITATNLMLDMPNGGFFHLGFPVNFGGTGVLSGASGISVASLGTSTSYQLTFTNTAANTFTGGLFIQGNAGVKFTANNQLGKDGSGFDAGDIKLGGGQLIFNPAAAGTVSLNDGANARAVYVNSSNGTIGTGVAGAVLQIPGLISGPGQMQFGGGATSNATGVVELTNTSANTYSGGTVIGTGILRIGNTNQLGTGSVFMNGGTLQASSNLAFSAAPIMAASSTFDTNGSSITLNGGLQASGGLVGTNADSQVLTKAGAGTLTFAGGSQFGGTMTINAGAANISGSGQMQSLGTVTVNAGAAFGVDDSASANPSRVGFRTNVTLNGAAPTLNITSNSAGSSLQFGTLTGGSGNSGVVNLLGNTSSNSSITFLSLANTGSLSFVGDSNFGNLAGIGTHVFFTTPPVADGAALPNVSFTGFGGSGPAAYSFARGVFLFSPPVISGTIIDNFGTDGVSPVGGPISQLSDFTATGATIAKLGATVFKLTLDGGDLGLRAGIYAPAAANNNVANNVMAVTNELISQNGAKQISLDIAGNSLVSAGSFNTISDLTLNAGVGIAGAVIKNGAGTLNVLSSNSTATSFAINNGTLSLGAGGAIPVASAITANATGTFNHNAGVSQTVASVTGAGTLSLTGASTLVVSGATTVTGSVNVGAGSVLTLNGAYVGLTAPTTLNGSMSLVASASTLSSVLSGNGTLNYNPASASLTTISGNNVGFTGVITGNNNARFTSTHQNALGAGTLNTSAQTISSSFSTPTVGFDLGTGSVSNVPTNFVLTSSPGILQFFIAKTPSTSQTITLSGLISGGSPTSTLVFDETGSTQSNLFILTNAANSFTQRIRVDFGGFAITSDGALGNAANTLELSSSNTTFGALRFDAPNIVLNPTRPVQVTGASSINTNGNTAEIAGVISGTTTLTKIGAGTLKFSNSLNTHTGVVDVSAGTLQVDGSIALSTTSAVNVKTGATLTGTGSILRTINVEAGGLLAPGSSPGIIDVNGLSMVANSTLFIEIDGNVAGDGANFHDQVNVTGTVALGSATLDLDSLTNYFPAITDLLFIIANDGADAVTGTFAGLSEGAVVTWDTYWSANISYLGDTTTGTIGNGNDVVLYNVVPAPGAGVLFGLAGVFASRRRRR